jgi:hypothetical protein
MFCFLFSMLNSFLTCCSSWSCDRRFRRWVTQKGNETYSRWAFRTWRKWNEQRRCLRHRLSGLHHFAAVYRLKRIVRSWSNFANCKRAFRGWRRYTTSILQLRQDTNLDCLKTFFHAWKVHTMVSIARRPDSLVYYSRALLKGSMRVWKRRFDDWKLCRFVLRMWKLHTDCVKSRHASNVCAIEIWAFKLKKRMYFHWKEVVLSRSRCRTSNLVALRHWSLSLLRKCICAWHALIRYKKRQQSSILEYYRTMDRPLCTRTMDKLHIMVNFSIPSKEKACNSFL